MCMNKHNYVRTVRVHITLEHESNGLPRGDDRLLRAEARSSPTSFPVVRGSLLNGPFTARPCPLIYQNSLS